jgi:thioredoxin-like negative regulator of GroEL
LDDIVSARATGEQAVTDAVKALRQDVDQEAPEAAQAKMPDLAAIRYHLGMRYAAVGQADKAAEPFKAAILALSRNN